MLMLMPFSLMAYKSTAMQYKVSVMSGMVTVELGLLRQKSSCWMSFTLLDKSTMAATKAQTLTPCREMCTGWGRETQIQE